MNIFGTQVINLIWNMIFVTIATLVVTLLITRKDNKKKKQIICGTILTIFIAFCILAISVKNFNPNIDINSFINKLGNLNFLYEINCWIIIMIVILQKCKINKKMQIKINKIEVILAVITIIVGAISVIKLGSGNINYVAPIENNSYIGNYYFNADIHRGIVQISSDSDIIHKIHPLYRFIVLPIMLPIIIMNKLLQNNVSVYTMEVVNGYIVCAFQVLYNTISSIIMYRILKEEKLKDKSAILGTIIFIFSLATIWTSILPETYAITTLTILLFIHLYQKRKLACIALAVISVGTNFMAIVPVGLICFIEFIKNIKKIKNYIKIYHIIILIPIVLFAVQYLLDYIINWIHVSDNIIDRLISSINYFLIPLLFGPNFTQNVVYLIQESSFEYPALTAFIAFAILSMVRIYYK